MKTIEQMLVHLREKSIWGMSADDEKFMLGLGHNADVSVLIDALKLTDFPFIRRFSVMCHSYTEKSRAVYILLRECEESGAFALAHNDYKAIVKAAEKRYLEDPKMTEDEFHASYMSQYETRNVKFAAEWAAFKATLRQPLLDWLEELL